MAFWESAAGWEGVLGGRQLAGEADTGLIGRRKMDIPVSLAP
jgi:hypothetical protein